jgi:hypothetical protein
MEERKKERFSLQADIYQAVSTNQLIAAFQRKI